MKSFDIPNYVLKAAIVLLFVREARLWYETVKSYQGDAEEHERELPESVKHMYA